MIVSLIIPMIFIAKLNLGIDKTYPSGNDDSSKTWYERLPVTRNPVLTLSFPIQGPNNHVLESGKYDAILSPDKQFILLTQVNALKARFPVAYIIELPNRVAIPSITAEIIGQNQVRVIYKAETIEAYSIFNTVNNLHNY